MRFFALPLFFSLIVAPCHAELFNGWVWNNTDKTITIQRTSERCWDPQNFTGKALAANGGGWSFSTGTSSTLPCDDRKYSKFVEGTITYTDNSGTEVQLGTLKMIQRWIQDGNSLIPVCTVEVANKKPYMNVYLRNRGCLGPGDTQSFTLTIKALASRDSSVILENGLNPNNATKSPETDTESPSSDGS